MKPLVRTVIYSTLVLAGAQTSASEPVPLHGTVLLGNPRTTGLVDGPLPAVRYGYIDHFATDADGNIHFTDSGAGTGNDVIRKITPGGIVHTVSEAPLVNAGFLGFDGQGSLHVMEVQSFLNPSWKLSRINEDGSAALLAEGAHSVLNMISDHNNGFVIYQRIAQGNSLDVFDVRLRRLLPDGSSDILFNKTITDGTREAMGSIKAMAADADGRLYIIDRPQGPDGTILRRVNGDGTLEDLGPTGYVNWGGIYTEPDTDMDILRTEDGNDLLLACSGTIAQVWDMYSKEVLASISLPPSDISSREFIVRCKFDHQGGILVLTLKPQPPQQHTLYRITTTPWQPQYPALHDQGAFTQMLQEFAGAEAAITEAGVINVQLGNDSYQLIADDIITDAGTSMNEGIHELADRNGDGLADFLLVFP